jgi:signal transduction histidine kinase/DNA-binding response OmpR family regulator
MHRLLQRQLRKYLGSEGEVPAALQPFVAAVNAAYADFDSDLAMLERSLELTSKELSDARDVATKAQIRLTDALESISEGFSLFDAADRMVLCNSRYRELYPGISDIFRPGLQFEQLIKTVAERRIVADAVTRPQNWLEERLARHRNPSGRFLQPQLDGRWIQISERKTLDGGTVAVFTDVTELKRREEELAVARDQATAATEAKSKFLASMSHELRTPLNAIIGYSEMLLEDAQSAGRESDAADLRKIQDAGKHLLCLIDNFLDLSKIEAGKMTLYLETFELRPMIDGVAATVSPLANKNGNALLVRCADDVGTIHSDLTKVRQTLFNLLSNACKFTRNGTITLSALRDTNEAGDWILFQVSDTGIGMTPDQQAKVFEAFAQADASTTRTFGGTGLGLTITKSFCRLMGGDVTLTSEAGKGTTFTVRLPAVTGAPSDNAVPASAERSEDLQVTVPEDAPMVLVVDDDPNARELLRRHLQCGGYAVRMAINGEEALQLARALRPDVVTLDVLMPRMDGWAVLTAMKDDAALAEIPVIMVTVTDNQSIGFSLGAAAYLTKPIDRDRLLSVVEKCCPNGLPSHVLIVEDDTPTRQLMRLTLQQASYTVTEAENGRVGWERLNEALPDAIVLDLMVPEMDGFIAEVRADARYQKIPVIVVTAKTLTPEDLARLNGQVQHLVQKNEACCNTLLAALAEALPRQVRRVSLDRP